jgi:NAD(P)-dependent dehydrogenase (short-subunit alcohol dehydrogenase family)
MREEAKGQSGLSVPKRLQGRAAIVTGAGQGLGRAIAERLAGEGATVAIADLREDSAAQVAAQIGAAGGRALALRTDVTQARDVAAMVRHTLSELGRLDILVNNAGVVPKVFSVVELPEEEWVRMLAVNLTSVFLCCREVARHFVTQERGCIVNVSSINGINPSVLVAGYNAAKAGVISLTKTLALELAAYGVRVNAVCPGPVYTAFNRDLMAQRAAFLGIGLEDMVEQVRRVVPLGRWGEPEDTAAAVAFLVSDDAAFITGESLAVAGGMAGAVGATRRLKASGPGSS